MRSNFGKFGEVFTGGWWPELCRGQKWRGH